MAWVPLRARMHYAYDGELRVESMEGPSFEFRRVAAEAGEGNRVEVSFLPWHRRWTHSLLLGALFGAAAWLAFARTGEGALAGLALAAGYFTHVLEDQLGHLGSNLWWPLTERRSAGLKLLHSGDALPNFATVWAAVGLLLFNLDRAAAAPPFDPGAFLLWAVAVPVGLMLVASRRERKEKEKEEAEIFDELVETESS
ncbi:MAG: metal-dependent hydrolase [Chloroflexi bacterium]|nr:metal-dependent hydrolase [Chloroflexota bacterium]